MVGWRGCCGTLCGAHSAPFPFYLGPGRENRSGSLCVRAHKKWPSYTGRRGRPSLCETIAVETVTASTVRPPRALINLPVSKGDGRQTSGGGRAAKSLLGGLLHQSRSYCGCGRLCCGREYGTRPEGANQLKVAPPLPTADRAPRSVGPHYGYAVEPTQRLDSVNLSAAQKMGPR